MISILFSIQMGFCIYCFFFLSQKVSWSDKKTFYFHPNDSPRSRPGKNRKLDIRLTIQNGCPRSSRATMINWNSASNCHSQWWISISSTLLKRFLCLASSSWYLSWRQRGYSTDINFEHQCLYSVRRSCQRKLSGCISALYNCVEIWNLCIHFTVQRPQQGIICWKVLKKLYFKFKEKRDSRRV